MRPTKAHFINTLSKANEKVNELAQLDGYEQMQFLLARHKKTLKLIQSNEKKAEYKKQILPEFLPWIEGVLESGRGLQDNVLMTWQVWVIDCGEYELALRIAEYAIHCDLVLPDGFERTLGTLIAEEFADKAKIATKTNQPFDVDLLLQVEKLVESQDMPDQSRARLLKEIGLLLKETDFEQALSYFERAFSLDENIGVTGEMNKLRKALEKQPTDN